MKLYESKFYSFELEQDRIINRWNENTDQMTYQDFQDALMNLAGFVIEHNAQQILIDTTNFKFQLPAENDHWRNDVFYPRITKVGKIKQALVMPTEYLTFVKDETEDGVIVPTRYFDKESEAVDWLTNG